MDSNPDHRTGLGLDALQLGLASLGDSVDASCRCSAGFAFCILHFALAACICILRSESSSPELRSMYMYVLVMQGGGNSMPLPLRYSVLLLGLSSRRNKHGKIRQSRSQKCPRNIPMAELYITT